jgi:hypothetical protein
MMDPQSLTIRCALYEHRCCRHQQLTAGANMGIARPLLSSTAPARKINEVYDDEGGQANGEGAGHGKLVAGTGANMSVPRGSITGNNPSGIVSALTVLLLYIHKCCTVPMQLFILFYYLLLFDCPNIVRT